MYPSSLLSIPNVSSKSWQRNGLVVPSVRETWQGKLEANPNQVYILFLSPPETRNLQIKRQWQYLHRRHHRTDFKSFIFASRRDFCRTQRQYWICRSFLMSRSIAMVCTLQRFPKRGNSSQFIALLTGLRPSILPSCLILAQFTAQGDLTQQIRF